LSALVVNDVAVSFGGNRAVDGVSCAVEPGEIFGIIGPNGAGKSTFINAISGLVKLERGEVLIAERDVTRKGFWGRCRLGLAMTFQIPRSDENLTVAEQLVGQYAKARHIWLGRGASAVVTRVGELLQEMELEDSARKTPSELTLGEIRRFELARAIANEPKVLLVDEPSSGMNAEEARLLARTLQEIARTGVAVVVIEHNIPFIRALAERTMVLDAGRIIEQGKTEAVLSSDVVKEAYLGTAGNAA
jgi:branched-chain amino acid transport system ATP-binding protein